MDEALLFRFMLILLYGMFASIRIYYRTRSSAPKEKGTEQKKGKEKIGGWAGVIMSVGIIGMFISIILYLLAPPWFLWSQLPLPVLLQAIGIIIGLCTLPLLIWTHRTLGKYYAPVLELKKKHTLITIGPYSRVRHPMYCVFMLFTLSMALITVNLFVTIFSIIVISQFPFIARQEETMLLKQFGGIYQNYLKRTGRFFPSKKKQV